MKDWKYNRDHTIRWLFFASFREDTLGHKYLFQECSHLLWYSRIFLKNNYIQSDKNFLWKAFDNDKYLTFKSTFEFLSHPQLRATYDEADHRDKILFLSLRGKKKKNNETKFLEWVLNSPRIILKKFFKTFKVMEQDDFKWHYSFACPEINIFI